MELKSYQKEVIADLTRYLELVVELQSPAKAYQTLWNEKNVLVLSLIHIYRLLTADGAAGTSDGSHRWPPSPSPGRACLR